MSEELFARAPVTVTPGAVHVPDWLEPRRQRELVAACREWAREPAGMRRHRTPGGGTMSVDMVSLGRHWQPYRYSATLPTGEPVKPFPSFLGELARSAVRDAYDTPPDGALDYDVAVVNFYDANAKMGMHRDHDERADAPVVSLSIGDSCLFRFGNPRTRGRPHTDVELRSGDLFVFGGPARLAYHGVLRTFPGTAPAGCGLAEGRLNLTLHVSGF